MKKKKIKANGGFLPSLSEQEFNSITKEKQEGGLPTVRYEKGGPTLTLPEVTVETPDQRRTRLGQEWFQNKSMSSQQPSFRDSSYYKEYAKKWEDGWWDSLDGLSSEEIDAKEKLKYQEYNKYKQMFEQDPQTIAAKQAAYLRLKGPLERTALLEDSNPTPVFTTQEQLDKDLSHFKRWKYLRGLRMGFNKFFRSRKDLKSALQNNPYQIDLSLNPGYAGQWKPEESKVVLSEMSKPNTLGHEYSHAIYGVTSNPYIDSNQYYSPGVHIRGGRYNDDYLAVTKATSNGDITMDAYALANPEGMMGYYEQPTEQYARFIQFCLNNNINPLRRHYSDRRLNKMRQKIMNGKMTDNQLFSRYNNDYLKGMFRNWFDGGGQIPLVLNDEGVQEWLLEHPQELPEVTVTSNTPLTEKQLKDKALAIKTGKLKEGATDDEYRALIANMTKPVDFIGAAQTSLNETGDAWHNFWNTSVRYPLQSSLGNTGTQWGITPTAPVSANDTPMAADTYEGLVGKGMTSLIVPSLGLNPVPTLGALGLGSITGGIGNQVGTSIAKELGLNENAQGMFGDIGELAGMTPGATMGNSLGNSFNRMFNYSTNRGTWYAPFEYMIAHSKPGKRAVELAMKATSEADPRQAITNLSSSFSNKANALGYILAGDPVNKRRLHLTYDGHGPGSGYSGTDYIIDTYLYGRPLPFKKTTGYGVHDDYVRKYYPGKDIPVYESYEGLPLGATSVTPTGEVKGTTSTISLLNNKGYFEPVDAAGHLVEYGMSDNGILMLRDQDIYKFLPQDYKARWFSSHEGELPKFIDFGLNVVNEAGTPVITRSGWRAADQGPFGPFSMGKDFDVDSPSFKDIVPPEKTFTSPQIVPEPPINVVPPKMPEFDPAELFKPLPEDFYKSIGLGKYEKTHRFDGTTESSQQMYTADEALANWQSAFMNYGQEHPTTQGWKRYYDAATNRGNQLPGVTVTASRPTHLIRDMATDIANYVKEDPLQAALDVTGFIPGVDTFSDIGQVGYDLSKGNWGDAAVSGLAALLPIASAGELKGILKGGDEAVEKIAKTVAEEAPRKRRPRIGERRTLPIEDPLVKMREAERVRNSASSRSNSVDEVIDKLVNTTDGGRNIINEAIKESLLRDPNYGVKEAIQEFSQPFKTRQYTFGYDQLNPSNIKGRFTWQYADEFKKFKDDLAKHRNVNLKQEDPTLNNIEDRYWYKTPDSYQHDVSSARYKGEPFQGKIIIQEDDLDVADLFNTGNSRMAHARYKHLVENNPTQKGSLLNTKVESQHLQGNGNRSYKENKWGHENQTYSLGQEMQMQLYNLLRNQLQRPITVEEYYDFVNKLPDDFMKAYTSSIHGGRYRIVDHSVDKSGVKGLLKLFGTTGAVGTAAAAASSLNDENTYGKGGHLFDGLTEDTQELQTPSNIDVRNLTPEELQSIVWTDSKDRDSFYDRLQRELELARGIKEYRKKHNIKVNDDPEEEVYARFNRKLNTAAWNKPNYVLSAAFQGRELPNVNIDYSSHPVVGTVDTWRPGTFDAYGFTGHSEVKLPYLLEELSDFDYPTKRYTAHFSTPGYNLVTNNCSDFALAPLLYMTDKPKESWFFNTPGDTRDFIKENYRTKDISQEGRPNRQGHSTYEFEIPLDQLHRLKEYQILQNTNRFMDAHNVDAITSPSIKLANGGTLSKYSKGTEHDLTNDEVFDLIKKGYKISYL